MKGDLKAEKVTKMGQEHEALVHRAVASWSGGLVLAPSRVLAGAAT